MVLCSTDVRCAVVIAEWALILITLPVYSLVLVALIHDLRRPAAVKIFNASFVNIFLYIAAWDGVSGGCSTRFRNFNTDSSNYHNR
jgi:hypothetical protein